MPKNDSIIVNRMDYSSGIAVGIWNVSTPGIIKALSPHRHDHYTCMLIEADKLEVVFDFKHLTMPVGTLFISPPGQVHQILETLSATGYYLSFESRHIGRMAQTSLDNLLEETLIIALSNNERHWFRTIFESIMKLQDLNDTPYRQVEKPLLSAFIEQAVLCYKRQSFINSESVSLRSINLTKEFRNLVKSHFRSIKRPSEFAAMLNITVGHLSDTVKKVTGLSASEHIQKEVMSEAQRLLYYTEISIKEISYQLGYQDTKYFIRLFSKNAGFSPSEYRKQYAKCSDQTLDH
ncbi:AraC family transcriptional regulator [Epilithonimonas sp. JDS]|jgi:AraC-like DNA-binding protein|uniref:AraC family transcriptional regulator n=1 Tax=Chryseobacterium group TaxID=2782232 RepID=UPI001E4AF12D|nr:MULTISPECIES: AraC family transcriptional regulator [Chryseobacterium group]MCD9855518.1 AraC family transcriptional regulator [Epilithonimonas sp. JDS]MDR6919916.1 AraC-like DNA-binding protein [Chryseobacterium sp. 2987]